MSETNVQVYENNTHSKFRNVNDRNHLLYLHQLETTSHGNHSDTMQTVTKGHRFKNKGLRNFLELRDQEGRFGKNRNFHDLQDTNFLIGPIKLRPITDAIKDYQVSG